MEAAETKTVKKEEEAKRRRGEAFGIGEGKFTILAYQMLFFTDSAIQPEPVRWNPERRRCQLWYH